MCWIGKCRPPQQGAPMARCSQVGIIMINGSNLRESAGPKIRWAILPSEKRYLKEYEDTTRGFSTWSCSHHSRNHSRNHSKISSISILFQPALRIHVFPPRRPQGLQPVPKEGLTAMKRGLEDIARKKCEVVKRRFDQANKVPIWEWDAGGRRSDGWWSLNFSFLGEKNMPLAGFDFGSNLDRACFPLSEPMWRCPRCSAAGISL